MAKSNLHRAIQSCTYIREMGKEILDEGMPNFYNRSTYEAKLREYIRFNAELKAFFLREEYKGHAEIRATAERLPTVLFQSINQPWKLAVATIAGYVLPAVGKMVLRTDKKYLENIHKEIHHANSIYGSLELMLRAAVRSSS